MDRATELRSLSLEVQRTAQVNQNGEVEWPLRDARAAIDALAATGHLVLGLDLREYDDDGRFVELPWCVTTVDSVVGARDEARAALDRFDRDSLGLDPVRVSVLVTWR